MTKNALVTGANGFIGSSLVENLLSRSYRVRCLVRKTSDLTWLKGLDVETVQGDLSDRHSLASAVAGAETIFHLAGKTKASSGAEFFAANAGGTENLLQAADKVRPGVRRFVYVSSLAAAGPSMKGRPLTENDPPHPVTRYGESKLEGERIAMRFADRIPVTLVRPPPVFGPRDTDILQFFRAVRKGFIPMAGMREQYSGFVYVEDLVRGIILSAEKSAAVGQTYYLVNTGAMSWKDFGRMTAAALGRRAISVPVPFGALIAVILFNEGKARLSGKPTILNMQKLPEYRERFWCCDGIKSEMELGFRPAYSMEEAVKKTVSWYQSRGWL
jgi:nucleoside-diphosphate-sugar epimerase